jgi:4-amino-4-deoxychorismate mutase
MSDETPADLRSALDNADRELVERIARRMDVCRRVAEHKRKSGRPMMQPDRIRAVTACVATMADRHDIRPEFAVALYGASSGALPRNAAQMCSFTPPHRARSSPRERAALRRQAQKHLRLKLTARRAPAGRRQRGRRAPRGRLGRRRSSQSWCMRSAVGADSKGGTAA